MILVLAMLMTMFVGIGTASASSTYEALVVPTISASVNDVTPVAVNTSILVTVPETAALRAPVGGATYDSMTLSFPSGVKIPAGQITFAAAANVDGVTNAFVAADFAASSQSSANTFEVRVYPSAGAAFAGKGQFRIDIANLIVQNIAGDLNVTIQPPLSGSGFSAGSVAIAKVVSSASGTTAMAKSVKTFGDAGGLLDSIIIAENMPGVFKAGDTIDLKVASGYSWNAANAAAMIVAGGWGLDGTGNAVLNGLTGATTRYAAAIADPGTNRILRITILPGYTPTAATSGRIVVGNAAGAANLFAGINVESMSKLGEIEVNISSSNSDVTEQDIVVAKYADFGVTVTEGTVEGDLIAGRDAVKIGKFYIEEGIASSLSENKTIYLELEGGAKWGTNPTATIEKGAALVLGGWSAVGTDGKTIKRSITNGSTTAAKICMENARVYLNADFEGDLNVKVYGSAGAEGVVKVATVVKPVKIEASEATKVVVGGAKQKAANITITEVKKGAILDNAGNRNIFLDLDTGYKFASNPKVTVIEGDLDIDSSKLVDDDTALRLVIKSGSMKASKIEISDVYLTAFRTVPEGPVKVSLRGALNANNVVVGSTALDEGTAAGIPGGLTDKSVGNAIIADCITPASSDTVGNGQFKINSNIYYVGGVAKVMDAAPYIKDSRTYVPMRFLGEILGAEVVWDDAARTVTLTKGDDVAIFTIGSTSYTVNGEAKTADVAPEIVNSRTMLPARFVAEAFGAVVGWDAGTQTVLIQQ